MTPTIRRARTLSISSALAITLLMTAAGDGVRAGVPDEAVRNSALNELAGGASGARIGWAESTAPGGSTFNAFVEETGGDPVMVNQPGREAFMGGIAGSTAVFQQEDPGGNLNLYRFDIEQQTRTKFSNKVNTAGWEVRPTLSGGRLLFARNNLQTDVITIRVFTLATGRTRVLASIDDVSLARLLFPGQINGRFATWHRCAPRCDVFLWDRLQDTITKLPKPSGSNQLYPAVTNQGVVYFVREGVSCGSTARIVRDPRNGPAEVFRVMPPDTSAAHLFAAPQGPGTIEIFYSRIDCGPPQSFDVFKLTDTA